MTEAPPPTPDHDLATRVRAALDAWEATGAGPTSSISGEGAIRMLEGRFARVCEREFALALPSGSMAIRAALNAAGVGPNTEVVVSALDWPAAASAALDLGARPVAADCRPDSLLVDPASVELRLGSRTRAVVLTHPAGLVADSAAVGELCEDRGVMLVEDISQSVGARDGGRAVGGVGDFTVCSLGPGKPVDAGEGGMLATRDENLYRSAVRLTQHPVRQLRSGISTPHLLALVGRIHPVAAILGVAGFESLEEQLARLREYAVQISDRVRGVSGVRLPFEGHEAVFSWSCVPALVDEGAGPELARADVGVAPLGLVHVGRLLDTDSRDVAHPNADRLVKRACRLFMTGQWEFTDTASRPGPAPT